VRPEQTGMYDPFESEFTYAQLQKRSATRDIYGQLYRWMEHHDNKFSWFNGSPATDGGER
jgi:hypothetical protein